MARNAAKLRVVSERFMFVHLNPHCKLFKGKESAYRSRVKKVHEYTPLNIINDIPMRAYITGPKSINYLFKPIKGL
jgi:hypothetical protein